MSGKILLLQFRDDESTEHERKCFIEKSGYPEDMFRVINAIHDDFSNDPLDILKDTQILITGASGQYDLSKQPEPIITAIRKTERLFEHVLETDFPTLAVCFGNQFIAQKLGGIVEPRVEMAETGTLEIQVTYTGKESVIFNNIPERFIAVVGHKESVIEAPDIQVLASTKACPIHAFRYKQNIYGVQFHPELDQQGIIERLQLYPQYLHGKSLDELRVEFRPVPHAQKVYQNFLRQYL